MSLFGALRAPREILFGQGQRHSLGDVTAALGTRALVCTDEYVGAQPAFRAMLDDVTAAGVTVTVFAETATDAPRDQVVECTRNAAASHPDVVIGIGGGSCLDMAKGAAVLLSHGGQLPDYYGDFRVPGPVVPIVAVPTTSGTGSEVTPVAVFSDPDKTTKVGISSPHLIPSVAICDPQLTVTAPPALTASAGADALTHAVEAFTAVQRPATPQLSRERVFVGKSALTDQFALLSLRCIADGLRRAYDNPADMDARELMMLAALAGGLAFGTAGTAAAHALQYPIGALTGTPHGVGVGTLLPYVMEYNRPTRVPEFAAVAGTMGWAAPSPGADRTLAPGDGDLAVTAIDGVASLLASIGIPTTLAELGMPRERLAWAADQAMNADRLISNNPRSITEQDAARILHAAWTGDPAPLRDDVGSTAIDTTRTEERAAR